MNDAGETLTLGRLQDELVEAVYKWRDEHPTEGTDDIDSVIGELIDKMLSRFEGHDLQGLVATDQTLTGRVDAADYVNPPDAARDAIDEALREHIDQIMGDQFLAEFEGLSEEETTE